jgi:hypothetical protein
MQPSTNQPQYKFGVQVFSVTVVMLVVAGIFLNYVNKKEALDYHFNGRIDSVDYNLKGQASIFIKGIQYDLFYQKWNFNHNRIHKGDSIIKAKNSLVIKLVQANGNTITQGDDN